jgi:hypothetical protein
LSERKAGLRRDCESRFSNVDRTRNRGARALKKGAIIGTVDSILRDGGGLGGFLSGAKTTRGENDAEIKNAASSESARRSATATQRTPPIFKRCVSTN